MCVCGSFFLHFVQLTQFWHIDTTARPVAKWYLNRVYIGAVNCENTVDTKRDKRICSSDAPLFSSNSQLFETYSLRLSLVVERLCYEGGMRSAPLLHQSGLHLLCNRDLNIIMHDL